MTDRTSSHDKQRVLFWIAKMYLVTIATEGHRRAGASPHTESSLSVCSLPASLYTGKETEWAYVLLIRHDTSVWNSSSTSGNGPLSPHHTPLTIDVWIDRAFEIDEGQLGYSIFWQILLFFFQQLHSSYSTCTCTKSLNIDHSLKKKSTENLALCLSTDW